MEKENSVLPTVSVVIPCFNEERYIANVIRGFLSTRYPRLLEILVADGRSTDRTLEIVKELATQEPRIKLVDNPERFQSFALNRALQVCQGDVYLRADAHCIYDKDYIERCVAALLRSSALNVGGAQRFIAETPFQAGVAVAVRSWLGSGGAKYRDPQYEGWAETVFLGCFWTSALVRLGGYINHKANEDYDMNLRLAIAPFSVANITNQDSELNIKLAYGQKRAIYIDPEIRVWYWPRKSGVALSRQYLNYGRGRFLTSIKHRRWGRGTMPFLGCICIALATFLCCIHIVPPAVFGGLVGACVAVLLAEATRVVLRTHPDFVRLIWRGGCRRPSIPGLILLVAGCIILMNVCHGIGFGFQGVRFLRTREMSW